MSKWILIGALAVTMLGVGLWVTLDPNARAAAAQAGSEARESLARAAAEVHAQDLWAPVASAFHDLADSVSGLWSGTTIQVQMPSIQLPH